MTPDDAQPFAGPDIGTSGRQDDELARLRAIEAAVRSYVAAAYAGVPTADTWCALLDLLDAAPVLDEIKRGRRSTTELDQARARAAAADRRLISRWLDGLGIYGGHRAAQEYGGVDQ